MKTVKIKRGRFKDQSFEIEGTLQDVFGQKFGYGNPDLPYLALIKGNPAAMNALEIDKYTIDDGPFYYGKIGFLGYIIGERDLK